MTILSLCPLLHQFQHLFNSSFCFSCSLLWPLWACVALQTVCLHVRHIRQYFRAGTHGQGQAEALPRHILIWRVTNLGYGSDVHDLTGTLLIRGGRLLLQSSGKIKTTMTVTRSLSYPLSCYYFMQLICMCLSVRSLSPVTGLQPVSSLASLWCHTCRSGLSRNDWVSQVPWNPALANQKRNTPGKEYLSVCMHACHTTPSRSVHAVSQESGS